MTDITKEQIEDTLNIARMLDNRGLLDLRHIVKIKQLALCGLETQRKPIEQAPKDGTYIPVFGGRRGSEMSGHEYEVDHEGPTLVSWESGHWWEPGEMCNYVKPTQFILLSTVGKPK